MNPDTNNEVARLRWEIKKSEEDGITPYLWDNRKSDNYDLGTLCRILNEYEEKTNEVARLREENQKIRHAYLKSVERDDFLTQENAASEAEVARLRDALKSCFWATNTYDGNYTRACDNVAIIVGNALKTQDNK